MSAGDLANTATQRALVKSFTEEATLVFRYLYFATIADFEGLEGHAALFRELAEGGLNNVHGCLDYLKTVTDPDSQIPLGDSLRNLQSVLQTEIQQFNQLYPDRTKTARHEGFTDIASWFETLEKLKRAHVQKLKKLEAPRDDAAKPEIGK